MPVWLLPPPPLSPITHTLRLTSPLSDSRCCWRELDSLTSLLLGPTRSARLPMLALRWPRWTPLAGKLIHVLSCLDMCFHLPTQRFLASSLPASLTHLHTQLRNLPLHRHRHSRRHALFFHIQIWVRSVPFWASAKIGWPPAMEEKGRSGKNGESGLWQCQA